MAAQRSDVSNHHAVPGPVELPYKGVAGATALVVNVITEMLPIPEPLINGIPGIGRRMKASLIA